MRDKKGFNCLNFKWKVQEEIAHDIKEKSWEEEVEYFGKKAGKGESGNWLKKVESTKKLSHKKTS